MGAGSEAVAATMMRRILIDYAKTRQRVRRGGVHSNLPLENALTVAVSETDFDLLALDEALTRLAGKEEHLARVVELRFFSAQHGSARWSQGGRCLAARLLRGSR